MRYLDPTHDMAFRKIFGDDQRQDSLISLINAVLDLRGNDRVVSVTIANPYQTPKLETLKETIVDVRAKDGNGQEFVVEMQCQGGVNWMKRALYATSKALANQLGEGQDYRLIRPVYFIGVLKFELDWDRLTPGSRLQEAGDSRQGRDWLTHHVVKDAKTNLQSTADFSLHFLELPAFNKKLEDCRSVIDKWAWFFKHAAQVNKVPEGMDEPGLQQAFGTAERFGWTQEELDYYENTMQAQSLTQLAMEEKIEDALAKGRKEGKLEGKLIGAIGALQTVLNLKQTPEGDLEKMSVDELEKLSRELRECLRNQTE